MVLRGQFSHIGFYDEVFREFRQGAAIFRQKVFELIVGDPSRPNALGWSVYRATHVDNLTR
jgi:hypothetical protein